jgi:hypothetical protein
MSAESKPRLWTCWLAQIPFTAIDLEQVVCLTRRGSGEIDARPFGLQAWGECALGAGNG